MCGVLSKVPFGIILKSIKPILPLIIISAAFNIFMTPGSVLCGWWIFNITDRGIYVAAFMACRLVYLIAGSAFLTLTTSPNSITDGLESGLGFLKYIKVPVHEIAMMMSIALRFIPILSDEMQKTEVDCWQEGGSFEKRNPLGHWFLNFPNGKPFTVNSTYYLYAIPQKEINANPNI